tara:strand:+ start:588 stop:809 length:222 start_codon:yes stop_codon:yes gene_type:complete
MGNYNRNKNEKGKAKVPPHLEKFQSTQKLRMCLKCNKEFLSAGRGNRFCDPCMIKRKERNTRPIAVHKIVDLS